MKKLTALILLTLSITAHADKKEMCTPNMGEEAATKKALETIRTQIDSNSFELRIDQNSHFKFFGDQYIKEINALKPEQKWVDMGAGRARAQMQYLNQSANPANLVAVSVKRPPLAKEDIELQKKAGAKIKKLDYMDDRFAENIPDEEFGKVDLITDVEGVLTYTSRAGDIFNKYLRILTDAGSIYIHDPGKDANEPESILVKTKDGKKIPFYLFISKNKGLKVEVLKWLDKEKKWPLAYRVKKTDKNAQIPAITFESADCMIPTLKTYSEK